MLYEFKVDNPQRRGIPYRVLKSFVFDRTKFSPGQSVVMRIHKAQSLLARNLISPIPKPAYIDVLKKGLTFPEHVVIIGSGPNGRDGYDKIHDEDFVIALNGAIDCPVPITIWAAQDPTLFRKEYFINGMRRLYDADLDISMSAIGKGHIVPVMEQTMVASHFPWVICTFQIQRRPLLSVGDLALKRPDRLRVGCTVAGTMIQMAYLCGARRITLCGIDMFGSIYWDGSPHSHLDRKDKEWGNAPVLNALLRHYEGLGMNFTTLSKTALEVESC